MTINITLSTKSIEDAIRKLEERKLMLEDDLRSAVEIIANDGAEVAQSAYGDWPVEAVPSVDNEVEGSRVMGYIDVIGDMPLIAEFGAGDATIEDIQTYFENSPETEVFKGSYSLLEGTREYWDSHLKGQGAWHFGGERYTEVPPHLGLYQAKESIIQTGTQTALGVMKHD